MKKSFFFCQITQPYTSTVIKRILDFFQALKSMQHFLTPALHCAHRNASCCVCVDVAWRHTTSNNKCQRMRCDATRQDRTGHGTHKGWGCMSECAQNVLTPKIEMSYVARNCTTTRTTMKKKKRKDAPIGPTTIRQLNLPAAECECGNSFTIIPRRKQTQTKEKQQQQKRW